MSGAELKDKDTEAAREEMTHHPGHCPDYPDYPVCGAQASGKGDLGVSQQISAYALVRLTSLPVLLFLSLCI